MKFSVEVDIDWIGEDGDLDDAISARIINGLSDQIISKFSSEAGKSMAQTAENLVKAKTEMLINTMLEKPVTISNGWNGKKEYDSIYDMIEEKMSALYEVRIGNGKTCEKDPILASLESHIKRSCDTLLADVEKKVSARGNVLAREAVKENEFIKRLEHVVKVK